MRTDAEIRAAASTPGTTWAIAKGFNDAGELEAVASTGRLDRDGESIEPAAWQKDLGDFQANPVILAAHQHRLASGSSSVIGSAVAIEAGKDGLGFRMKFAGTELGREYEQLYREKHMRAFSVGFLPAEGRMGDVPDAEAAGGKARAYIHTRVKLLEISCVPVPSNADALAKMAAVAMAKESAEGFADAVAERVAAKAGPEMAERVKAEIAELRRELVSMVQERFDELIVALDERGIDTDGLHAPDADDDEPAARGDIDGAPCNEDTPAQAAAKRLLAG